MWTYEYNEYIVIRIKESVGINNARKCQAST